MGVERPQPLMRRRHAIACTSPYEGGVCGTHALHETWAGLWPLQRGRARWGRGRKGDLDYTGRSPAPRRPPAPSPPSSTSPRGLRQPARHASGDSRTTASRRASRARPTWRDGPGRPRGPGPGLSAGCSTCWSSLRPQVRLGQHRRRRDAERAPDAVRRQRHWDARLSPDPSKATASANITMQALATGRLAPGRGRKMIRRSFPLKTTSRSAQAGLVEAYEKAQEACCDSRPAEAAHGSDNPIAWPQMPASSWRSAAACGPARPSSSWTRRRRRPNYAAGEKLRALCPRVGRSRRPGNSGARPDVARHHRLSRRARLRRGRLWPDCDRPSNAPTPSSTAWTTSPSAACWAWRATTTSSSPPAGAGSSSRATAWRNGEITADEVAATPPAHAGN